MPTTRPIRARAAFTLFEAIVGMFILLVGVLGIVSVFGFGMQVRLHAQELVISQDLANMWADWIRVRINESKASGGYVLHRSDLAAGKRGDFYNDSGDFHSGSGNTANLPTYQCNAYRGFQWEITAVKHDYKPRWIPDDATQAPVEWDKTLGGSSAIPPAMGSISDLTNVELSIVRGARRYKFNYIFSGVGIKHARF